jgi:hypothetical protein
MSLTAILNGEPLTFEQLQCRQIMLNDLATHFETHSCCGKKPNWREWLHSQKYEKLRELCHTLFFRDCC